MEQNEANEHPDLLDSIKDDQDFSECLTDLVYSGELRPIEAIQLYCHRHHMPSFGINNLMLTEKTPRLEYVESLAGDFPDDASLLEAVRSGDLLACHALYLFCSRRGINSFQVCNLTQAEDNPRPPVVEFLDSILVDEFAGFLRVVDRDRRQGRL